MRKFKRRLIKGLTSSIQHVLFQLAVKTNLSLLMLATIESWLLTERRPLLFAAISERSKTPSVSTSPEVGNGRSILFLHHCYYHFSTLAAALRRRGWDAVSATVFPRDHPARQFMQGIDVDLGISPVSGKNVNDIMDYLVQVPERFKMVHLYGPTYFVPPSTQSFMWWDLSWLKRKGVKLGYTVSGCLDGVSPIEVNRRTGGICGKCIHQLQPKRCSVEKNTALGFRLSRTFDLISLETDWRTPPRDQWPQSFPEFLTACLDPDVWHPDLEIPEHLKIERKPGHILVINSFANYDKRAKDGRDIKGSWAILEAVDRLQHEGYPLQFQIITEGSNEEIPFLQVQADIILEQLNYGRLGATARQGLMLGKPVLTNINVGTGTAPSLMECPAIHVTEETIYNRLKEFLDDPERIPEIGRCSRQYAMKWFSADACAERFECVFDSLMAGNKDFNSPDFIRNVLSMDR